MVRIAWHTAHIMAMKRMKLNFHISFFEEWDLMLSGLSASLKVSMCVPGDICSLIDRKKENCSLLLMKVFATERIINILFDNLSILKHFFILILTTDAQFATEYRCLYEYTNEK